MHHIGFFEVEEPVQVMHHAHLQGVKPLPNQLHMLGVGVRLIGPQGARNTEVMYGDAVQLLASNAAPGVQARAIELQTPTPGLTAAIYASNNFQQLPYGDTTPLTQRGWTQVAAPRTIAAHTTVPLSDPANVRYRYYLIWINKLPPSSEVAEIAEATLFS